MIEIIIPAWLVLLFSIFLLINTALIVTNIYYKILLHKSLIEKEKKL